MSSLTLTIGGVSFISQPVTGSMKIKQQLGNKGDVLDMQLVQKVGQTIPSEGQEIIFKDGSRFLFAGYVTKIDSSEVGKGQLFTMNLEASDYTYILNNKIAIKTYSNQSLYYIVNDLMNNFVPSGYGLSWTGVENPGPIINSVYFNYITIRKCFEKLHNLTGYNWWVDYQKVIHFQASTAIASPESFTDVSGNHESINIQYDTSQIKNSIVLKGGNDPAANTASNKYTGDGNARQWFLQDQPTAIPTVKIDGVVKTVGSDPTDNETDFNYMYSSDQKYVRASSGTTTLTSSNVIEVIYPYNVPILAVQEDAAAIALLKSLEGGDGRHQFAITDNTVKSKKEARQKAKTQLQLYAYPLLTGKVYTRTGLLANGSYFSPGQYIIVNLPSWGINVDTQYLIQEVNITSMEDGSRIEYYYEIIFGGRYQGLQLFLEGLAEEETVDTLDTSIDTIRATSDFITLVETITRNAKVNHANETLAVAETITHLNTTPPFKWQQACYLGDGLNSYADCGSAIVSTLAGNHQFAISCWFRTTKVARQTIAGWYGGNYLGGLIYLESDNSIWCAVGAGSSTNYNISGFVVSNRVWHHVVLTYDGTAIKLYLDNVLVGTSTHSTINNTSGMNFIIGKNPWDSNGQFQGKIDKIKVYSAGLTSGNVSTLYGNGDVATNKIMDIDWEVQNSDGTYNDSTSNGNNATLKNNALLGGGYDPTATKQAKWSGAEWG